MNCNLILVAAVEDAVGRVDRSGRMTTRKTPTKTKGKTRKEATLRRARGKASVERGRKFEDAVADLYRLLGAQVVQNIEIHQKKVDILATFRVPGSSREHRVIVECKDEARAVNANQRVQAFKGLLDIARLAGTADSAEIITRAAWSDQAKGFAKSAGIDLFTYAEKISQLIDLTSYLKNLVAKFERGDPARPGEPALGKYYVDLSGEKTIRGKPKRIDVIDNVIHNWIKRSMPHLHLAIFGEYGSGKSSLCQKISHDLAASYLQDANSSRIPVLLNLREFIGKLDLEAYITSFLDRECKATNPRIELFKAMNDAGIFLLIFDGFDEMAVKVDADTLESNLLEIEKLTGSENARVLLTSRPEYFISRKEEEEALKPGLNPFLNRVTKYEPIKILPWDADQVALFLRNRVPLVKGATQSWTYYRDKINSIGSLSDLSQRPVLLDMIVKTLPRLIAGDAPINLPNLYRAYLIGEMKRQKVLKKRSLVLSDDDRLTLLQQIAIDIFSQKTPAVGFIDAQNCVERIISPPKHELEAHTRDFLTNSFLIRIGDNYYFSHKSIMEYLVAAKLHSEVESSQPDVFGQISLEWVVLKFLKELQPNLQTLMSWITLTTGRHLHDARLGGNAATLICECSQDYLTGKDLSSTDLYGAKIDQVDLRNTNFDRAILKKVSLRGSLFFESDLANAIIENAQLTFYFAKTLDPTLNFDDIFGPIRSAIDGSDERSFLEHVSIRGPVLAREGDVSMLELLATVRNYAHIEAVRSILASVFHATVGVYANEVEELFIKYQVSPRRHGSNDVINRIMPILQSKEQPITK